MEDHSSAKINAPYFIQLSGLDEILQALRREKYQVIGPTIRDGAIVYDQVASAADLPTGWTDVQEAGQYRLKKRDDRALFGYNVGPHSWKKFLYPSTMRLFQAHKRNGGFEVEEEPHEVPHLAFIGVRSCELRAIAIQDKVFLGGAFTDSSYQAHREKAFLLAVNCGEAGGTCFCASMNTGPKVEHGYDLVLTEVCDHAQHYLLVEAGSERGARILAEVTLRPAQPEEEEAAARAIAKAAGHMGRHMDTVEIREMLQRNYENPRWDAVAARCLTCANCTMVCPTCFCSTVEDVTDLKGENAERLRKWDSCFTTDFSYIHGGSIRAMPRARYRQWLTHKLASWIDQFGTSGCVGCGRCITWCPVAIDITEEVRAIRESDAVTLAKKGSNNGN
jgi:formate hydrogenlyase subunit 6/NADH:ubiquinone oxidoreductase subunit I